MQVCKEGELRRPMAGQRFASSISRPTHSVVEDIEGLTPNEKKGYER